MMEFRERGGGTNPAIPRDGTLPLDQERTAVHTLRVMSAHLPDLKSLSVSERIQLVEDIWDSIEEDTREEPGLTTAQLAEVDRRVAAHLEDPSSGIPWAEVREKLFARPA